ncbi:MAG TPA: hypothetical protein VG963_10910, partial [Polyangiaceae bacterium]|nr:hypothetical protein [Polyangiaceae bacterium]
NLCKAPIGFEQEYFVCSVSTCNRKRTGLFFCSLGCFEAHLPTARHRDAWAEPQRAPSAAAARAEREAEEAEARGTPAVGAEVGGPAPQRRIVGTPRPETAEQSAEQTEGEAEVLVVVSKLKKYVRDRSGMNTSDGVLSVLSDHLRALCNDAIRQAGLEGRRTVLERDFAKVLSELSGSPEGNFRSRR